jgi:biopolymer transport protein ExbD
MIDVVFQLVLFFMVSTTFLDSAGIQVDLPKSSADVVVSDQTDLSIWMTLEGKTFVAERQVTEEQLESILRGVAEKEVNTLIKINADAGVAHGRVVELMDMVRSTGLTRLAIATESDAETPTD